MLNIQIILYKKEYDPVLHYKLSKNAHNAELMLSKESNDPTFRHSTQPVLRTLPSFDVAYLLLQLYDKFRLIGVSY
jgi:hypothetical protein